MFREKNTRADSTRTEADSTCIGEDSTGTEADSTCIEADSTRTEVRAVTNAPSQKREARLEQLLEISKGFKTPLVSKCLVYLKYQQLVGFRS